MEALTIAATLDQLAAYLKDKDYGSVEIVVVVPTSTDGTAAIARSRAGSFKQFKVVDAGPRVGKGRDVRLGIFESSGRYRVFMDADLATPLVHLDEVKAFMDQGGQIGIAVRDLLKIHKSWLRKIISASANIAAQLLVVPGIKDTQCGFKAFQAAVAEDLFSHMTMLEWSFDMEVLAIARMRDYKIEFFETPDWRDPKAKGHGLVGDSRIKVVLNGFFDPFKIRLNIWTGRYKHPNYVHKPIY
jgi:dolichyl-phosphate beta-glucosyltransferase